MRYLLAPMEGVTGYVFRNAYHAVFEDFDEYVTPFLAPTTECILSPKELKEVSPSNNQNMHVVPQIITSKANQFVEYAKALEQLGYQEVNLNLGCPSPTVVTKKKGAGVLQDLDHVRELLEGIKKDCPIPFSVKTRVGFLDTSEYEELLSIYASFDLSELIIHPRTRKEFYTGAIHDECVDGALSKLSVPVVYNGDICSYEDCEKRIKRFAGIDGIMLGRGLAANPMLLEECKMGKQIEDGIYRKRLEEFLDRLLEGYAALLFDDATTLFRLKELWSYLSKSFEDIEKPLKRLRKTTKVAEYRMIVSEIVRNGKRR